MFDVMWFERAMLPQVLQSPRQLADLRSFGSKPFFKSRRDGLFIGPKPSPVRIVTTNLTRPCPCGRRATLCLGRGQGEGDRDVRWPGSSTATSATAEYGLWKEQKEL